MHAPPHANAIAYGPNDAAKVIGLSRARLYELIASGEIPARKSGRRTLILHADLERYTATLPLVDTRHTLDEGASGAA